MKTFTVATSSDIPTFSWIHSKNGSYSVKSGYWLWNSKSPEVEKPNISPLYEAIWKVKAPPKIQHFLWRCITQKIAVGEQLSRKRILQDPSCPRCGADKETVNHVLFECGFARLAWAASSLGYLYFPYPSAALFTNLAACLLPQTSKEEHMTRFSSWPWLLWRIWKARNDLCLQNIYDNVQELVKLAEDDARGWHIVNQAPKQDTLSLSTSVIRGNKGSSLWRKPSQGSFKCNLDGSWKLGDNTCGVGWVIRDCAGKIRWYGMKTYPSFNSPLEVEAAALIWAMNMAENLQFTNVIFEMDCRELYKAIKNPHEWQKLRIQLEEINKRRRSLRPSFQNCTREANNLADLLAKKARLLKFILQK